MNLIFHLLLYFITILSYFVVRFRIHSETRQFFNVHLPARRALRHVARQFVVSKNQHSRPETETFRSKGSYGRRTRTRNLIPEARLNLATYVPQDAPPCVTPVTCSYILYDTVNTAAIPLYVARAIARSTINSCARYFFASK